MGRDVQKPLDIEQVLKWVLEDQEEMQKKEMVITREVNTYSCVLHIKVPTVEVPIAFLRRVS